MKKSSKKRLQKRGITTAGRAPNAAGAQVHADKRRAPRPLEKQRLQRELQHETARSRGPFSALKNWQRMNSPQHNEVRLRGL